MEGQINGMGDLSPYTALAAVQKALEGSRVKLGAQNMFWAEHGAFTGSPPCSGNIVWSMSFLGHSSAAISLLKMILDSKKLEAALSWA